MQTGSIHIGSAAGAAIRESRDDCVRRDGERLAADIDQLFAGRSGAEDARRAAARWPDDELRSQWFSSVNALETASSPRDRLAAASDLLVRSRDGLAAAAPRGDGLALLRASLVLEEVWFAAAQESLGGMAEATRRERLELLQQAGRALYGVGLLSRRQDAAVASAVSLLSVAPLDVGRYRQELAYLSRVPGWSARALGFQFDAAQQLLARIEPQVVLFGQDRLRGSPGLFAAALLDQLLGDANVLAGVTHTVLGEPAGAELRALNPGAARGELRLPSPPEVERLPPDVIAVLPETTSELPPVAGILTEGEGSSLSHVQLLARNLGVPNVVVRGGALERLRTLAGQKVVLLVSPGGVVQLAADGPDFDDVFAPVAREPEGRIVPDLEKLDLAHTAPIDLGSLRADDSGRRSGPKGANLGELRALRRPCSRRLRDPLRCVPRASRAPHRARRAVGLRVDAREYRELDAIDDRESRTARAHEALARLRQWIRGTDLDEGLVTSIREALRADAGRRGAGGAGPGRLRPQRHQRRRSAGLHRRRPQSHRPERGGSRCDPAGDARVWASPFTERAFAWRQSRMDQPEYVFPAVVVQRAFPAEKSGVMVTLDVDTGDPDFLSVAANEGVGGAVDGQEAEVLRIPLAGGRVRLLSQATAAEARELDPAGGIRKRAASGREMLLTQDEVLVLVDLTRSLHRFPSLLAPDGSFLPGDVEFAFRDGKLALLQIRPFVESPRARRSARLAAMDQGLSFHALDPVDLDAAPVVAR